MVNTYINKDMPLFFVAYNKLSIFYMSKEWFFAKHNPLFKLRSYNANSFLKRFFYKLNYYVIF